MSDSAKKTKTQADAKPKASPKALLKHLRGSDLRAVAKLAVESTQGIRGITEGVHQAVHATLGMSGGKAPGRTGGLTGLVYQSLNGITAVIGHGIDAALHTLQPLFDHIEQEKPGTPERENVLAVLNGVMGDRLVDTRNPLATPMSLRHPGGKTLTMTRTDLGGKIVVLVHGLCVNELYWQIGPDEELPPAGAVDIGAALAQEQGYTPLYLRYNTGRHISHNGTELAQQLDQLIARWPVPVTDLTLIGYSMGGLVIRSACQAADSAGLAWRRCLKNLVCLATPHHGSPLERAGNLIDVLLGVNPYSAPYGKLLKLRSAGITDLRYGLALDSDWQGHDRFRRTPDRRTPLPLPDGVRCFALATTLAARRSPLTDRLTGDGLVPLHSALGEHDDPARTLHFSKADQAILYRMNHMEVPRRPEVAAQVLAWLGAGSPMER